MPRTIFVTVPIAGDVLTWLKTQSKNLPERINEILRDRMELSAKKSAASRSRKTFAGGTNGGSGGARPGAGRPRSPQKPRCPCGEMTMARSIARGHRCEPQAKPRPAA